MKKFLCCIALALSLICVSACGAPKWELGASVENKTVAPGETFTVVITTKNVGGDSQCDQSKKIGALPALYLDIGASRVYLAFDGIFATTEARTVIFAGGETVEMEWTFHSFEQDDLNNTKLPAPAGSYTLKLTFEGTERIIENFLTVAPRG